MFCPLAARRSEVRHVDRLHDRAHDLVEQAGSDGTIGERRWRGIRSRAAQHFTGCCWALSAPVPSVPAFALPFLKRHLGPDRLVAAAVIGTACALILFGLARRPPLALAASVLAGVSWISVLATVNVSAQLALPGWVRDAASRSSSR